MNKNRPEVVEQIFVNRRTGEESQVPVGIDPGFGFNVGEARLQALEALVREKLASVVPALAKATEYQGMSLEVAAATYAEEARLKPKEGLPRLPLGPVYGEALESAKTLNLDLSTKMVGLEYSGTRHVFEAHGRAGEQKRGQVPITAGDVGLFAQLFNMATLKAGTPDKAPDGVRLIQGEVVLGAYHYTFVAKVGKYLVTLYSLFKRLV